MERASMGGQSSLDFSLPSSHAPQHDMTVTAKTRMGVVSGICASMFLVLLIFIEPSVFQPLESVSIMLQGCIH